MLEQIKITGEEGKAKIETRFGELTESLEEEKRKVKEEYVSKVMEMLELTRITLNYPGSDCQSGFSQEREEEGNRVLAGGASPTRRHPMAKTYPA